MEYRIIVIAIAVIVAALLGYLMAGCTSISQDDADGSAGQVFEMRIYTTYEGRLDALNARFRDHTLDLFEKHGMTNIGYWVPQDPEKSENTLIYIISHKDRETAASSWASFRADPDWQKAAEESQLDGAIVSDVESIFMDAIDYSPLK